MEWTHAEVIGLAKERCHHCHGTGLRRLPIRIMRNLKPCNCVLRAIFRACFNRFQYETYKEKYLSKPHLHRRFGVDANLGYDRRDEDYVADFFLVSRRSLTASEWAIFSAHCLLGADWRMCCHYLRIERGEFFHAVYRIQVKLGRIFRELEPYSLFPLDEYFRGTSGGRAKAFAGQRVVRTPAVKAPLAMAARG